MLPREARCVRVPVSRFLMGTLVGCRAVLHLLCLLVLSASALLVFLPVNVCLPASGRLLRQHSAAFTPIHLDYSCFPTSSLSFASRGIPEDAAGSRVGVSSHPETTFASGVSHSAPDIDFDSLAWQRSRYRPSEACAFLFPRVRWGGHRVRSLPASLSPRGLSLVASPPSRPAAAAEDVPRCPRWVSLSRRHAAEKAGAGEEADEASGARGGSDGWAASESFACATNAGKSPFQERSGEVPPESESHPNAARLLTTAQESRRSDSGASSSSDANAEAAASPEGPASQNSSSSSTLPPRIYSSIPEIVAPPGRAFPFPLPQLSSKLTGVPDAAKPTKGGQTEDGTPCATAPSTSALPRPSFLRLLPYYPRQDAPPVDDGLLEEIISAKSREDLHASLEKLQDSKYVEWLLTPQAFRDTEGFLADTDSADLRARFSDVYEQQKEQLHRWLEELRRQPGRRVRMPAVTDEEKEKLLTLKVPKRFVTRRDEMVEKQEVALKWKEGPLAADRELIDAGGLGGFVRDLEIDAWAALFPVGDSRFGPTSGAEAARKRLELATRLQIRQWREEERRAADAAGLREQHPGEEEGARRTPRDGGEHPVPTKGVTEDRTKAKDSQRAETSASGDRGQLMTARVREAAEALAKQQMLASMGLPHSVQALAARYGHVTPDSPVMAAPDARNALQLLQRAVMDSESFLLGHIHRGLQSDPDIEVVRTIVQAHRERQAAQGRPPPRTGHPVEFTPAMFEDWEESETQKDIMAVAAEATVRRLEAARRIVEGRDPAAGAAATEPVSHRKGEKPDGRHEVKDRRADPEEAEDGGRRREADSPRKNRLAEKVAEREGGRQEELPVPARLLQGAAAAARGGIGARALEAVRWVLADEIKKEYRRQDNEEYHSMVRTMETNVVRAKEERRQELERLKEEMRLQRLRDDAAAAAEQSGGESTRRGAGEKTQQGGSQSAAERGQAAGGAASDRKTFVPTHEEEVVARLRALSKDLGEASGLFQFENDEADVLSGQSLEASKGSDVAALEPRKKDVVLQAQENGVPATDGTGRGNAPGPLAQTGPTASLPVSDIFAEMEEAMRVEWRRHLGHPCLRVFPGQLVKGRIVKVTPSFAYVHVGYVCEGELRLDEVLLEDEEAPKKGLKAFFSVGDEVFCEVVKVSHGELILSLQTLRRIAAWEQLLALQREDRPLKATVLHAHRGGLVVRVLGLRGFLPTSQLPSAVKSGPHLVGAQLPVALLQADVERQRLLVSSRLVHIREQMKRIKPDQVVEGEVVAIHPFGVLVQFGECRGLLHLSEISAARVERLEEILPLGSPVRALVLHYDKPTGKIALTTKLLERYPGEMVRDPQAVFAAAVQTAETYALRKREEKTARRNAAQQLIAALGLDPASALGAGAEGPTGPDAGDEDTEEIDTSYARSYASDEAGSQRSLWRGMRGDDSKVMALLSRKLLEKAATRRRKLGGDGGKTKFAFDEEEDGPPGIDLFRAEREKVLEAVKASGIELKGAWNVPSVFEADWETEQWLFE
ncbi:S1 RNA binding domain-containing protein [Besnoitia besnoiti]|uniref:S1 RNA binding domain-containing protein n=1 Tax=Besnoitia besnoiti TaxID=94643 RepID=A0A2A9MGD3_BESBE|nr:S1 RNA binding domain-containing protein [Besnoitia besnoiti]PFH34713.1 S1 RNA binding domain-containing protein [Besnoitia besnoiti]